MLTTVRRQMEDLWTAAGYLEKLRKGRLITPHFGYRMWQR